MGYGSLPAMQSNSTTMTGGSAVAAKEPMPISPMQDARNGLSNRVSYLHDRLGDLERRLDSVCRPSAPSTDQANAGTPPAIQSDLRSYLIQHAESTHAAIMRIESLLDRLDV